MSAPVRNNSNADEPEFYAPQRGRESSTPSPQQTSPSSTGPDGRDAEGGARQASTLARPEARPSARLPRGPNIPLPPVHQPRARRMTPPPAAFPAAFDAIQPTPPPQPARPADVETAKPRDSLHHQLALGPVPVPEPEPLVGRQSLRWFATVAAAAAIVAGAVTFVSLPETRAPILFKREVGQLLAGLPATPKPTARLIVEGRQTFANEALPLGVALKGATGSEFAFLTGLAAGTRLSVGGPYGGGNGWRIPVRELDGALAYAPKDFVGVMDAAIDLRLPNDLLLDSQALRLEWVVAKQPDVRIRAERSEEAKAGVVVRPLDGAEVDLFVRRGQEYLSMGDIVSARLVLRRAANAGNPQAALALGATFDPSVLTELGVLGFAPDLGQARIWYQRALELGSTDASRHIERLAKARN